MEPCSTGWNRRYYDRRLSGEAWDINAGPVQGREQGEFRGPVLLTSLEVPRPEEMHSGESS